MTAGLHIIFTATWQASILAILVLALQFLTRRHLPARFRFALWFLVLIRLAAIPLPESRLSIFNFFPSTATPTLAATPIPTPKPAVADGGSIVPTPISEPPATISPTPSIENQKSKIKNPLPWPTLLLAAYLAGSALIALRILLSTRSLHRIVKSAIPVTDPAILAALDAARFSLRIRRPLPLLASTHLASPALVGLLRPRLFVPQNLLTQLTPREFQLVFLHECAHLRRHDIFVNYWLAALSIVHWFNPVFWLILPRIRADRELAADELALLRTSDRSAFGHTLLKLLESTPRASLPVGTVGIFETRAFFKRRITMIARFRPTRTSVAFAATALLLVTASATLTTAITRVAPALGATPAAAAPAPAPAAPAATPNESPADRVLREKLDENLKEIAADSMGLDKVLAFFKDSANVNMDIRWTALQAAGIDKNTPVTVSLKEVPFRKALKTILSDLGTPVDYVIEDGVLTISTREELQTASHLVTHVYNVRDLLDHVKIEPTIGYGTDGKPVIVESIESPYSERRMADLAKVIEQGAAPETWRDMGGNVGAITSFNGLFTITTTPAVHQQINEMLKKLREADKQTPAAATNAPAKP